MPRLIFIHRDFSLTANETAHLLWVTLVIIAMLILVEWFRRRRGWPGEFSRKFVHVATGGLVFAAPLLFRRAEPILLISAAFTVLDYLAYRIGFLHSVHHVKRASYGTAYYPLSLFILAYLLWDTSPGIVVAAMGVMALGDGAAGITGELIRAPREYRITSGVKSVQGSALMFLASFAALNLAATAYGSTMLQLSSLAGDSTLLLMLVFASVSLFATAWEASCTRGLDNLTVPLMTAFALHVCLSDASGANAWQWIVGTGLGALVAVLSVRLRFLRPSGAFGAFMLACILYGTGGWKWTAPVVTFFVLSSLLSRTGKTRKSSLEGVFEKTGTRDIWQVAANGGVAGSLAILSYVFPDPSWFFLYLGSVATVTADTWGTEIGVFSAVPPRHVLTGKAVLRGASGGITFLGSAAGILGAGVIALSALPFVPRDETTWRLLAVAVAAGALGSLADSVLGATVQAQYRCNVCGKMTERRRHCDAPTLRKRGWSMLNNDGVNIAAATAGALLVLLFSVILV